jgi:hypothetical protein
MMMRCHVCSIPLNCYLYVHTYHSRFIPEGIADASQILLRDAHVLPKLFSYEKFKHSYYHFIEMT